MLGKSSTTDTVSPRRPGYPDAPALASCLLALQICHESPVPSCCLCIPALRLPDIPSILSGNPAELAMARLFHLIITALPHKEETPFPTHQPHTETESGLGKRPRSRCICPTRRQNLALGRDSLPMHLPHTDTEPGRRSFHTLPHENGIVHLLLPSLYRAITSPEACQDPSQIHLASL